MHPVLRLLKHNGAIGFDYIIGDFFAAVGRHVVHHDRVSRRTRHQRCAQLVRLERLEATRQLLLVTHRGPDVRVHRAGVRHRRRNIVRLGRAAGTVEGVRDFERLSRQSEALGRGAGKVDTREHGGVC